MYTTSHSPHETGWLSNQRTLWTPRVGEVTTGTYPSLLVAAISIQFELFFIVSITHLQRTGIWYFFEHSVG